jgi:hypothetical protein
VGSSPDDFVLARNKRTSAFPRPSLGLAAWELMDQALQMNHQGNGTILMSSYAYDLRADGPRRESDIYQLAA